MSSPFRRKAATSDKQLRPASTDFKPKFPLDPFAAANSREPWFIRPDALPSTNTNPRCDVLLVLGSHKAPSTKDLDALLSSSYLARSLLVIATHQPPAIPSTTLPTVRILRLENPLALENTGAVRFVNILEWAERVARLWRKYGGYGVAELSEGGDGQEHLPPPNFWKPKGSRSVPPSPTTSTNNLPSFRYSTSSSFLTPDGERPAQRPRSFSSKLLRKGPPSLPAVDPSQRPFDALINFLPNDVADKSLLKQAILVTTISKPFLIAAPDSVCHSTYKSLSGSRSSVYLSPTPPYLSGESLPSLMLAQTRAHLVHVLPLETRSLDSFVRSKLVQSLEGFLLSFGSPTSHDVKRTHDDSDRPRPYIMTSSSLEATVSLDSATSSSMSPYGAWASDYSLVELVLCGCLDGDDASAAQHNLKGMAAGMQMLAPPFPRALLASASDVVMLPEDAPTPPAVTVSQSDPGYHRGATPSQSLAATSSASHRQFVRHSNSSVVHSAHSRAATSTARSTSPGSPLAKGEKYVSLNHSLPTPPDSEESGGESGIGDVSSFAQSSDKHHPTVTVLDDSVKPKKSRWKFWRRTGIAVS
ncbi:hypothetical protein BC835DRAFT_1411519 [Cytidiella melzeri]|nr:hypothetical protein BC835DRAFT_1411519 [Cytidiella melzeri]